LTKNGSYAIIDLNWWTSWIEYAGLEWNQIDKTLIKQPYLEPKIKCRPGPIQNRALCLSAQKKLSLREDIHENIDYVVVDIDTWNFLHSCYGGGPVFIRGVRPRRMKVCYSYAARVNKFSFFENRGI
jgi:hypothetical protein